MKRKKLFAGLLVTALLLCGCGSDTASVYVQSVKDLAALGGIAPGDRFAGLVVSENVAEITKDESKTVAELLVSEGDDVTQGQALFTYDTDQLQLDLDKKLLEQEQLKASIENYQEQIDDLEDEKARASSSDKLQYTIQIQTTQLDLKEAELNLKAKETEIAQAQAILENASVVSPVTGRVQTISENGYDNYGNPLPYITIQQSGAYRVKGTIGELQLGGLTEGTPIRILSRTDESAVWYGTVSLIDYENPTQGSSYDMYYGVAADEMTASSRYPFYVTLDSTEGLLLGQHVYMELDVPESETAGVSISNSFICYNDDGSAYVWAENRGKLEMRDIVLGIYDPMTDTMEVTAGLTEEDFIAFPDPEICVEGAKTTHTLETVQSEDAVLEGGVG